jgi:O-antigen/teichoic acid export membrane protein
MRLVVAFNTLSQLLGKLLGAGATFFISLLIAQSFGVEGYGDFVKITTYISFFFLIADFGLNAVYLQKQKEVNAFSTLLSVRVIGSMFLVFLSLALLAFLPQGTTDGYTNAVRFGIILFSPAILFQGLITTTNAIFQKRLRYDLATASLSIGSIVSIGILLLILQNSISPSIIGPIALLSGSLTTTIVAFWFVKKLNEFSTFSFSLKHMHELLWSSLPLGLTLIFTLVYGHIDSIILTLTRNTTEVGIYGLAYKAFELILVIPTFFMNAVYPIMVQATSDRRQLIIKKSFWFLLLVSCLMSLVTWICAPFLVHVQEGFIASVPALRVLSLSVPFFFLSSLVMWTLIALKKQLLLAVIYGLAMILNISLNLWLIPQFGYMAAAWTTVVCEGLVLLLSGFFVLRYSAKI